MPLRPSAQQPSQPLRRPTRAITTLVLLSLLAIACAGSTETADPADPAITTSDVADTETSEVGTSDAETSESSGCLTALASATVTCTEEVIVIESDGLPDHQMMVGIEPGGWNGQWPTTQDYTGDNAFVVPTSVTLLDEPLFTVRNAAGVIANGVPFFFPHAPGQGDCIIPVEDAGGECLRDPVADGEMDDCGGHTGRGDDYHYHAAPVCLLDQIDEGAIVGYMLDGIPIYVDPLPDSVAYDGCTSGYVSPDGVLHYAFQDTYPYLTDCMLGAFEVGGGTQPADTYTGDIDTRTAGSIVGFDEDDDGCHTMTFSNGEELYHCH